jgi:hypothetical protein
MCACTCVVTQHMSSNTQNKPSQADQGIGRKEGSGKKSRNGDGKYSTISENNIICNISKEIKDFTKSFFINPLLTKLTRPIWRACQATTTRGDT